MASGRSSGKRKMQKQIRNQLQIRILRRAENMQDIGASRYANGESFTGVPVELGKGTSCKRTS